MFKKKDTFRKINPQQAAESEIINQQVEQNPQLATTPKQKQRINRFVPIDNDRSFDTVNQNVIWNSQILLEMANDMYS